MLLCTGIPEAKAIELAHLVMKETVERMVKRMKPTITTTNHEKGDLVIQTATIDHAFFERRLAGVFCKGVCRLKKWLSQFEYAKSRRHPVAQARISFRNQAEDHSHSPL